MIHCVSPNEDRKKKNGFGSPSDKKKSRAGNQNQPNHNMQSGERIDCVMGRRI